MHGAWHTGNRATNEPNRKGEGPCRFCPCPSRKGPPPRPLIAAAAAPAASGRCNRNRGLYGSVRQWAAGLAVLHANRVTPTGLGFPNARNYDSLACQLTGGDDGDWDQCATIWTRQVYGQRLLRAVIVLRRVGCWRWRLLWKAWIARRRRELAGWTAGRRCATGCIGTTKAGWLGCRTVMRVGLRSC